MRAPSILTLLFVAAPCLAQTEPLTIKGVGLGDSIDKMGQIGICALNRGGMCVGKTEYGPIAEANFIAWYVAGKITEITVTFDPRFSATVFEGLTRRFGESSPTGCKPGVTGCHTWKYSGTSLTLLETVGAVRLTRQAPADGY